MHGILSEKTVIYVTHQVEFLNAADLIVVSIGINSFIFILSNFEIFKFPTI